MKLRKTFSLFLVLFAHLTFAQRNITVSSPDKNLVFKFKLTKTAPIYSVAYKGQFLIDNSELSLSFKETGNFGTNLEMAKPRYRKVEETYELIVGKTKNVRNHYREVKISLRESEGAEKRIDLIVRVFDDGLGFRYEFPEQENWKSYVLLDEISNFNIAQNPIVYSLFWGSYSNAHEGLYNILPYQEVKSDTLMDMPALFEFPNKTYMAITEANLRDYAGMYLKKNGDVLTSQLSPLLGQTEIKVKASLPHRTPWRVLLISDRLGALIESNIITSLNNPSKIEDTSWIKPGKTSFHWWNGDIVPDTIFAPGINFKTNKYYIDFCARNKIEYHAVIGYGGFAWYKSDAAGYGVVGPNTDITKPVASLDMQKVCDYAKKKGVAINVWVHWKALYPQLEKAFKQFEEWGVKGLMVDFINRDDQEMVNIMEEILQSAARHKLYIQFHGSFKPTGLHRTYPNEFTREGAHNYEHNKWRKAPVSADHDLNVVFTRMLAGATDYHLGGFRAVPKDKFKIQFTRPLMGGTRCHMMAMYVVLESYLNMVADYPSAYEGEPGFDFITNVPTTWDQTVVPSAELQQYVVIARRKGNKWFLGALNNSKTKSIEIAFDFLPKGRKYSVSIYTDAKDAETNPNHLIKTERVIQNGDVLNIDLAASGGAVMEMTPSM